MSPLGIEFEDQKDINNVLYMRHQMSQKQNGAMIESLIKSGVAKNEKGATILLGIVVGIFLLISAVLLKFYIFKGDTESYYLSEDLIKKLPFEIQDKIRKND